ncbi:hypothetical protein WA026_001262 [Henosepilachna vigintioctopunctata]|uniref:Protein lin-52 homolog n=1 Tax=Henosepilachna vigintioctopunctata TaxID=420089 RepID=A0AAW1USX5_9CUCU
MHSFSRFREFDIEYLCWYKCNMATEKPGSIEQGQTKAERELEASLYSMEILDRASPELWPENFPGMSEFTNKITQSKSIKLPYSRELTQDDQNYMHQLASLPTTELISRVKQLHDIAYQLGVEETKEITRGKYLNLFNKRRPKS